MSSNDEHGKVKHTPSFLSTGASFIYPVRSLLTGIQSAERRAEIPPAQAVSAKLLPAGDPGVSDDVRTSEKVGHAQRESASTDSGEGSMTSELTSSSTRNGTKDKRGSPNFRDFTVGEDPLAPRTFATCPSSPISEADGENLPYTIGPMGEVVEVYMMSPDDEDEVNPRHPKQMSEAAADAFAQSTSGDSIIQVLGASNSDSNFINYSQSGIVHLAPVEQRDDSDSGSSGSSRGRKRQSSGEGSMSPEPCVDVVEMPSTRGARPQISAPDSASASVHGSSNRSTIGTGSGSDGPHITFRYQHIEDENGHHLIVGREGTLTRCEDEPIRTPGAVQGFGVLIALREDPETGNLEVRQVSENSTELLGLPPQYLFSLECFTQTFPDSQADLLFDNIQYLSDTALTPEEQAENLHVFMLSGYGAPRTALPEDTSGDVQQRRSWTCWCAAHRPQMTAPGNMDSSGEASTAAVDSNIIILEFELERDAFNPLYPPVVSEDSSYRSGVSSPSDASGSTGSGELSEGSGQTSDSSGRTLVSTDSEGGEMRSTPEGSTPSLMNSNSNTDPSFNASVTANSPTPSSQGSQSVSQTSSNPQTTDDEWLPSPEDILESTTSRAKPLLALERLRRSRRAIIDSPSSPASFSSPFERGGSRPRRGAGRNRRGGGAVGMMDVFAVMAQINEQLGAAADLDTFLKVVVGVIKDLTQFHRVLVYQFDEAWNGKVMAELVDWTQTHDLYKGLHFPAADIPAQARELYILNKVRLLYDRGQPTARLIVRSKKDLETPLDMTHCYLRSMSPIHLKYLGNMGVRASMSVSIMAFGNLWGLVACHSYGPHGMRVSFPVRQMLRLLSQSISRNVERLSYAQRLHTRKLINTMPSDQHPSGYIVSNADDLLGLFDADYGVLVIGEGAKILGQNQPCQEILIVAEYLRLKQFGTIQVSQALTNDYPDLQLSAGLEIIAGLLYVPLSAGGRDFIAFLRKGQPRQVKWAGRPFRQGEEKITLEPRKSFKLWSETVAGRCRAWSDEHMETAGVLSLVYGKFIEVWRQKESALQTTKLTNILLSNASHEGQFKSLGGMFDVLKPYPYLVRTPLNHIINYLELALNGPLDRETRENLSQSHAASKSLLFTINDLLDLTRLESGNETSFNEPFNLPQAIEEATMLYRNEAARRGLHFSLDMSQCPKTVVGDVRKIRTVVANLTANAVKYTRSGTVTVMCRAFEEPAGLRSGDNVAVELVVEDTGCGIPAEKLESIFREFEQVEVSQPPKVQTQGLGLGLAVVARIVEQLGGQLRVDSKLDQGSRFSFLIPFCTDEDGGFSSPSTASLNQSLPRSRTISHTSRDDQIDNLVQALSSSHMLELSPNRLPLDTLPSGAQSTGYFDIKESLEHWSSSKMKHIASSTHSIEEPSSKPPEHSKHHSRLTRKSPSRHGSSEGHSIPMQLRVLIVEDNDINRNILAKRLSLDGHTVVNTTNGQEGLEMVESDREFDCVLMDIQMPLLNGYEATERIRALEQDDNGRPRRLSQVLNGRRIPIFAVSASLFEEQREDMRKLGIDGWILKPIDFKRLRVILKGVTDVHQREKDVYKSGSNWEVGGWLTRPTPPPTPSEQ